MKFYKRKDSVRLYNSNGFTLIELLVVIAVIGILAAIILASLNGARDKSKIAAIKSNLRNAASQGEIYFTNNGTYMNICTTTGESNDAVIQNMMNAIRAIGAEVKCYSGSSSQSAAVDWGLGVIYDTNKMFIVSPQGVMALDTVDDTSPVAWQTALNACTGAGKKIPSFSPLRAIWMIKETSGVGGLFNPEYYWSSTEYPANPAQMYGVLMGTGTVMNLAKTSSRYVRCAI